MHLKKQLFLQLIVFCFFINCINAQTSISRVPYRIYDNFDTGEMYTWEAYPYAQDTGHDPTFTTKKEPAYGGKGNSLIRITRPNDATDLTQGFNKRIDLYTLGSTRVKFVFFLMGDRKPGKLDVSLGTFDGRLYTHTIKSPKANTWVQVDLPIESFTLNGKSLSAGEHIQVVVVQDFYPLVSHLLSYSIFMDEFSINGERLRQFVGKSPATTWFEQFGESVIHRHYAPGETFMISVAPEGGIKLKGVSADLITPDEQAYVKNIKLYDDGTHGDSKASDGVWSNNAMYDIKSADPRGQWKARFTGVANEGSFSWDLRFIVPVSRISPGTHPRVYITSQELAARRAGSEPAGAKKLLDNMIKSYRPSTVDVSKLPEPSLVPPESSNGGPYASKTVSNSSFYGTHDILAGIITNEAWQFFLAGNKEAGERGKAALLRLCALPSWITPWMEANGNHTYFPGAPTARAAGLGYDLLYSILTEQERITVRNAILNKSIKLFYRDMVEMNRMPSSNSNHIAVTLSGVGTAIAAIAGDDPAMPGLEPYLSGFLAKTKQFIDRTVLPQGSYNEPYTYQAMALRELVEALYIFDKNYGVDYTSTTYMKEFYYYPLYVTQNRGGRYQDMGDVSPTYSFTQAHSQWLVYKMKDPFMYKYVKPLWDSGSSGGRGGGILPYLWYTEGITPIGRETLPTSKLFAGKGHMVMRSSWDDSGSILIFKAGPNGNHYHYDQGNILLTYNGEELLADAGHSTSYYSNLYYPGYYTQAIGHNTMLVDMNAESQAVGDFENDIAALRKHPKITHAFAGEIASAVEGDLTSVYKGKVSNYTRTILFDKTGPIFLFDKVKSGEEHSFNWIFHAEHNNGKSSIVYSGNRMTITQPAARLTMDVFSTGPLSDRIRTSDRDESFIALSSEKLKDAYFLAVMTPEAKSEGGEPAPKPKAMRLDPKGWIGTSLKGEKGVHYGFFKLDNNAAGTAEGFTTDASRFTATIEEGKLSKAYFEGSNFEAYGSKVKFSAPVTAAVAFTRTGTDLEVNSARAVELTLASASKPSQVIVNGSPASNWKFDQNAGIVINLSAGESKISIK